ncbi:MAG: ABC transporter permease [Bacillota bacterium]|nr:ABC transporter permease [Bacillota bacterium]
MRTKALVKRIIQQMLRDKRTLGLLFVAPLMILTLMYFLFNSNTATNLKVGVINVDKTIVSELEKNSITVKAYSNASNDTIVNDKLDGLLQMEKNKLILTLQNNDPTVSQMLKLKINQTIASVLTLKSGVAPHGLKPPSIEVNYVYGNSETTFFDIFSTILVGFFVFFFVFLISGIGLLRERTTGTLERLMSTPIKRWEVITGYLIGYGIFAVLQTLIIVTYAIKILNLTLVGSIWYVLLINLIVAFVALSLGILLSTFAASEFQMMQFIPIIIIPQIFFAGIFPVENMAKWLQVIAKIMPIYYCADALKSVMYKGLGFNAIKWDILVLAVFAAVFVILNIFALKKYRKL